MKHRVAITGMGVICSAGASVEEFTESLLRGRSCLYPIDDPRLAGLRAKYAGLVRGFDADRHAVGDAARGMDRFVHFALAAARQALEAAGLEPPELGSGMGLLFATCSGPMRSIERHYERIAAGNPSISSKELYAKKYYSGAQAICRALGIEGLATTVTTACSASAAAVGIAADLIECGMIEAALAGGSDTFSPTTCAGFDGLKATCETFCAPFSTPVGLNLGEGSAFVVLENMERARGRGAPVYGEILGYGMSNDAYHCSAPDPSGKGQALAMQRAFARSGLSPREVPYVNAHGTGTAANDKAETRAVMRVFGEAAQELCMSSTKSITGHCLGAAGCIELIASIVCARRGVFPSTANFAGPREGCAIDCVPEPGRKWRGRRIFMSNSFAFGGNNVSIIAAAEDAAADVRPGRTCRADICVTACESVTAAGIGNDRLLEALEKNRRRVSTVSFGAYKLEAGVVPQFDGSEIDRRLDFRSMDRPSRFAVAAARLALKGAGFRDKPHTMDDLGFFLGLSNTPSEPESEHIEGFFRSNCHLTQVHAFPYIVPNSIAGNVSRALMLRGHNTVVCGGPGTGLVAAGLAAKAIEAGHAEACLAGAVDELSQRIVEDNFLAGVFPPPSPATPAGEGAAMIMLETVEHARTRGAVPRAIVKGMAFYSGAGHGCAHETHRRGLKQCLDKALENACISPSDVGVICCDSSDMKQRAVLESIFGSDAPRIFDVSPVIGQPESALPLCNLAFALGTSTVEPRSTKKYILASFLSPQGFSGAMIFETIA